MCYWIESYCSWVKGLFSHDIISYVSLLGGHNVRTVGKLVYFYDISMSSDYNWIILVMIIWNISHCQFQILLNVAKNKKSNF